MESKNWVKFSHIIVFFLLATSFETLMARKEREGQEVIKFFKELTSLHGQRCPGKQSWPELVGVPTRIAKAVIQQENPYVTIVPILLAGTNITDEIWCDRVRLFDNILGVVVQEPVIT